MSKSILGLYVDPNNAADAMDGLKDSGFERGTFDVLTGTPYPEGASDLPRLPGKRRSPLLPVNNTRLPERKASAANFLPSLKIFFICSVE